MIQNSADIINWFFDYVFKFMKKKVNLLKNIKMYRYKHNNILLKAKAF